MAYQMAYPPIVLGCDLLSSLYLEWKVAMAFFHTLYLSPLSPFIHASLDSTGKKKTRATNEGGGLLTLFLVCGARALQVPSHTDTHTPTRAAVGFFSFCFFIFDSGPKGVCLFFPPLLLACLRMDG